MRTIRTFAVTIWILLIIAGYLSPAFAISIPEEKQVAKEFMEMVEEKQMLLKDPIANHLVRQIGEHLLSFVPPQPFKYSFYIVDEDVFNAFAAPGANIFCYRGLITSLDSADELAGIIGHEIAHADSRHVSESIDRAKYISIGSLAGLLAGAIIGESAGAEAGEAIMTGSIALGHTSMLAFTRKNETEADEKGIMFLKRSCFSPQGLLSGLLKIRAADFRGVESIPDYVKTHPGTGSRIAHTETILSGYKPNPDKPECRLDFEFEMVKYRLMGLYGQPDKTFKLLDTQLSTDPINAAVHYGIGLLYARKLRKEKAVDHLQKALSIRMLDPMILVELARVYLLSGEPKKALPLLEGLESEPVIGLMARYHLADTYLELNRLKLAERGYKSVIFKLPDTYPKAYFNLAKIKSMNGEKGLSHYYLGIYYSMIGNRKNAILHLNKALETLPQSTEKEDAQNRLEQLKKRKMPPPKS